MTKLTCALAAGNYPQPSALLGDHAPRNRPQCPSHAQRRGAKAERTEVTIRDFTQGSARPTQPCAAGDATRLASKHSVQQPRPFFLPSFSRPSTSLRRLGLWHEAWSRCASRQTNTARHCLSEQPPRRCPRSRPRAQHENRSGRDMADATQRRRRPSPSSRRPPLHRRPGTMFLMAVSGTLCSRCVLKSDTGTKGTSSIVRRSARRRRICRLNLVCIRPSAATTNTSAMARSACWPGSTC